MAQGLRTGCRGERVSVLQLYGGVSVHVGCRWTGCVRFGCLTSMLITCWACLASWLPGRRSSRRSWQVSEALSTLCPSGHLLKAPSLDGLVKTALPSVAKPSRVWKAVTAVLGPKEHVYCTLA